MEQVIVEPREERANVVVFPRFGECSYRDSEVLEFPWGLPGFGHLRKFVVLQVAGQDGFIWLQSLDDTNVALPLADPWSVFEDYDPHLPHYATAALGIEDPEDFVIMCVVVVTKEAKERTMNLLAPIVINLKTRTGRQVMLENSGYSARTPMPRRPSQAGGAGSSEGEAVSP
jgi:flagellar assembly factor FliW